MHFWIIEDGQKTGPFEDYQVRELIREGKIVAETRVWHEGAAGWVPAKEIQVLEREFIEKDVTSPTIPLVQPPFLAWRRLGARVFDYFLYQFFLVSVLRIGGIDLISDPSSEGAGWLVFGALVPAILMEAALLISLGFTPGKWLMSLRVEDHQGRQLSMGFALIRTMRVWVLGMGMMIPILMLFGHAVTLWFGLKKGAPLWDLHSGFRVPGGEVKSGRVLLYWTLLTVIMGAIMVMVWPEVEPELRPMLAEFHEEMQRQWK